MVTSENTSDIVSHSHIEDVTTQEAEGRSKKIMTIVIISAVVLLALLGIAIYFLLQPGTPTDRIRDVFIIVVALESLVIGVALVILIIQLASLINLLQNEVRPILKSDALFSAPAWSR